MSDEQYKKLEMLKERMLDEADEIYWRPEEPGEYVWGILEDVFEEKMVMQSTGEELVVRVAKLKDPETGQIKLVRLMHKTLKDAWERYKPEIGDLVLIKLIKNVYDHDGERLKYRVFGMSIRRRQDIEHIIPVAKILTKREEEEEYEEFEEEIERAVEKATEEEKQEILETSEGEGLVASNVAEEVESEELNQKAKKLAEYTISMLRDFYEEVTESDLRDFAANLGFEPSDTLISKTKEILKNCDEVVIEDGSIRLSS